jgi:hypothetical protein
MTTLQDNVPAADSQLKTMQVKNPTESGVSSSAWATLSYLLALSQAIPYVAEVALVSSLLSTTEEATMQQLRYLIGGSEFGPFARTLVSRLIGLNTRSW